LAILLLLTGVLGINFLLVRQANLASARRTIQADLASGARVFDQLLQSRLDQLRLGARLMADDWAFRRLYGGTDDFTDPTQRRTILSGLENYQRRMPAAAFLMLVSFDDEIEASTARPEAPPLEPFPHPELIRAAEGDENFSASGFVRTPEGEVALLIVVPILLPDPAGWIVAGFRVDDTLADELAALTRLEISFVGGDPPAIEASTLPAGTASAMQRLLKLRPTEADASFDLQASDDTWISRWTTLPGGGEILGLLQRSLSRELAPFRQLEQTLLLLTFLALAVSTLLAIWMARGISKPVQRLVEGVTRIEQGTYTEPVEVTRRDELGQLAVAFNEMAAGLEERDRVRDLLGKNVSREIASELLRRPTALGGEVKEVTVMFTDLRGFTSLSERMPPEQLLDALNEYFTIITRTIEEHGGVVDKYIGDAVMAIFGAPLEAADHPARAVRCAEALQRVLGQYEDERRRANLPPLATGIGLATGAVIAGNMGSESRHNYTVIGDAVNLAARLQDQTKQFKVNCVIAHSTAEASGELDRLRPLGETEVRGKQKPVAVYTLPDSAKTVGNT